MLVGKTVRLQPNKEQEQSFRRFVGTARFAWNVGKEMYDFVRRCGIFLSQQDLIGCFQEMKHNDPDYAWLNDVPEAITKHALKDLLKAYQTAYGKRKAHFDPDNPGKYMPKFKKRGVTKESFYQRTDNIHKTDDSHVKITGIKKPVKCLMLKGVDLPEHILNPRISFDGKYWYLSYSYEISETDIIDDPQRDRLGIDLGVKSMAVFSDGEVFANINKGKEIKRLRRRLKHIQRTISRKYEANVVIVAGRKVYHKTNNIRKLEQQECLIYRRIRNIQETYMHKVTNAAVRTKPRTIVLEDLNVKGMLQNLKLAKAVQEERFYRFRQMITYKCQRDGIDLVIADRWYPSSKTCSRCGNKKKLLRLTERTYRCEYCGFVIDRDLNAAINLENYENSAFYKQKTA